MSPICLADLGVHVKRGGGGGEAHCPPLTPQIQASRRWQQAASFGQESWAVPAPSSLLTAPQTPIALL